MTDKLKPCPFCDPRNTWLEPYDCMVHYYSRDAKLIAPGERQDMSEANPAVTLTLHVYDHQNNPGTDTYPDIEAVAKNEGWAQNLIYTDMEGFAVSQDGQLILMDECGNYAICPTGRFTWTVGMEVRNWPQT